MPSWHSNHTPHLHSNHAHTYTHLNTEHRSYLAMATPELEGATVEALEALGLGQLDSLETANTVIGGDLMDLLDTTELPPATVRPHICGRDRFE